MTKPESPTVVLATHDDAVRPPLPAAPSMTGRPSSLSPATASSAEPSLPGLVWLTAALRLDAFRAVVGVLLAVHFAGRAIALRALPNHGHLFDAAFIEPIAGQGLFWGRMFARLPFPLQTTWFVATALLSLLIAVAWHARLCAVMAFAMAVEAYWGTYPASILDDRLANLVLLWLVLLPVGRTLRLHPRAERQRRRSWADETIPTAALAVFGAQLALLELTLMVFPSRYATPSLAFSAGLLLSIAGLVAPWKPARRAAFALIVALHVSYAIETRLFFTSAALLAGAAVFFLDRSHAEPCAHRSESGERSPSDRVPIGADVILAAALLFVFALGLVASRTHWAGPANATQRILSDLGLAPPASLIVGSGRVQSARVESDSEPMQGKFVHNLDLENDRARGLLELLAAPELEPLADLRARIAQHYAKAFCTRFSAYRGPARLLSTNSAGERTHLAWLSCGGGSENGPMVIMLDLAKPKTL